MLFGNREACHNARTIAVNYFPPPAVMHAYQHSHIHRVGVSFSGKMLTLCLDVATALTANYAIKVSLRHWDWELFVNF